MMISKFDDFFKRHNYYIQISGLDSKKLMVNEIDIDISELRSIRDFIIGLGGRISYIKGCFCSQQDGGYIFINKLNDDWYILEYRGKSFKCDQIEGLYKCIQDICFSIKLDESVDNGCNLYGKVSKFDDFNIHEICKGYGIENYTIRDGLVDVDGDVDLSHSKLNKLPLKFGYVTGYFDCSYNNLSSLEGSPKQVGEDFYCHNNKLTNLEGAPIEVGGNFYCYNNQLTNLEGAPREVGGDFLCDSNQLPKEVLNFDDIKYLLKWQDEYNIWRNGKLDLFRFNELIKDYDK